jgi:hypothetical protein
MLRPGVLLSALSLVVSPIFASVSISTPDSTPNPASGAASGASVISGSVADTSGAVIPGAEVDLDDPKGAVLTKVTTDGGGNFSIASEPPGDYVLSVSQTGFKPATQPVHVGNAAVATVAIKLAIAPIGDRGDGDGRFFSDLSSTDANGDTSVMTSADLKALPVFDNDYVTAMSSFLGFRGHGDGGQRADGGRRRVEPGDRVAIGGAGDPHQ